MVCDKTWCVTKMCVTKLCEKDVCVCVLKMVHDNDVGVWQWCVLKMVCDEDVCGRWCVTKMCVKDCVWSERWCVCVCVWQRWCLNGGTRVPSASPEPAQSRATPATQSEGQCPRVPHKTKVTVSKCHACHAKWRSMSPSAMPATQSATPATQSDGRCHQATQSAAATTAPTGTRARHESQPSAIRATPATQREGRCHQEPRLPRRPPGPIEVKKCHACHAKWRSMSPSTMPATQSATPATQSEGRCHQVPCLPRKAPRLLRKVTVDATKCHACHVKRHACYAKWRSMPPSATPATQSAAATTAPKASPVP